ncbi:MAG: hypothetical protein K2X35_05370 [Bryobacteraceae bacterium]|nr:hypothetical protein [Bryobacteraceae bacterium]
MNHTQGKWSAVMAERGKLGKPETMRPIWLVHQIHAENRPQPIICELPEEADIPTAERRANAHLIAAAPDLYEAAQAALLVLGGVNVYWSTNQWAELSAAATYASFKLRHALSDAEAPE